MSFDENKADDVDAVDEVDAAEHCLDGQDIDSSEVDISGCPELPRSPDSASLGIDGERVGLGAWELNMSNEGDTFVIGSIGEHDPDSDTWTFAGRTQVDEANITCWAKGYYRLRKILQDPPADYVTLSEAGFQGSFFQFQTDKRKPGWGYPGISSYKDHLVKWVTIVEDDGSCSPPTLQEFKDYAAGEVARRGLETVEEPEDDSGEAPADESGDES
jgi:hypothetical protein